MGHRTSASWFYLILLSARVRHRSTHRSMGQPEIREALVYHDRVPNYGRWSNLARLHSAW